MKLNWLFEYLIIQNYQVSVVSPLGTPCFKLTVPYGIPVAVLNAIK